MVRPWVAGHLSQPYSSSAAPPALYCALPGNAPGLELGTKAGSLRPVHRCGSRFSRGALALTLSLHPGWCRCPRRCPFLLELQPRAKAGSRACSAGGGHPLIARTTREVGQNARPRSPCWEEGLANVRLPGSTLNTYPSRFRGGKSKAEKKAGASVFQSVKWGCEHMKLYLFMPGSSPSGSRVIRRD